MGGLIGSGLVGNALTITGQYSHNWVYGQNGEMHCSQCGYLYNYSNFGTNCPVGPYQGQYQGLGQYIIQELETKIMTKEQLQKNKFYLGTANPTGHATIEEAIEQAKAALAADKTKTEQTIVQIVKVVRKELPPVTVVDVE